MPQTVALGNDVASKGESEQLNRCELDQQTTVIGHCKVSNVHQELKINKLDALLVLPTR